MDEQSWRQAEWEAHGVIQASAAEQLAKDLISRATPEVREFEAFAAYLRARGSMPQVALGRPGTHRQWE